MLKRGCRKGWKDVGTEIDWKEAQKGIERVWKGGEKSLERVRFKGIMVLPFGILRVIEY